MQAQLIPTLHQETSFDAQPQSPTSHCSDSLEAGACGWAFNEVLK